MDKVYDAIVNILIGGMFLFIIVVGLGLAALMALGLATLVAANLVYAPVIAVVGTGLYFFGKYIRPRI